VQGPVRSLRADRRRRAGGISRQFRHNSTPGTRKPNTTRVRLASR
jgi:hypothetical protein